jgi:hypothetical protein
MLLAVNAANVDVADTVSVLADRAVADVVARLETPDTANVPFDASDVEAVIVSELNVVELSVVIVPASP